MGDWKLLKEGDKPWQLFNLRQDIAEATDLAARESKKVAELLEAYQKWDAKNIAPRWSWA
jgi:arylsulfatase